ncbi:uncharacterized protein pwn isoform X1 [Chironomus tepperi]|uniref:uncharacterized protein pwn isoform X1 n=1 Tax=Chironomus tepperi TaxID=113505 RepID=UPI00391F260B
MNHNKILNWIALSLFFLELTCFSVILCQNSVSQISPKSIVNDDEQFEHNIQPSETIKNIISFDDETMKISPSMLILNEEESTIREINEIESNNIEVESSGRYHETIRPTLTFNKNENEKSTNHEITDEGNFLVKGGRRARSSSRPLIQEMDTVLPMKNVNSNELSVARQNNDIQGIISGIVKLLNGNVNVHTNNQGTRRPPSNRINNRGPPRIAEAQVPGNDIQESNNGKPQQSFPEPPLMRPFLTAVPIPEQIVPSMQQNYRPGFISQNRPPWKRTKPPISRRPPPQYTHHHIPTHFVSENQSNNSHLSPISNKEKPIVDENNYDDDDDDVGTAIEEDTLPPSTIVEDKEISSTISNENISSTVITIIESTSEVNTVDQSNDIFSTLGDNDMNKTSSSFELEPSTNEILPQIPVTFTPTLIETSTTTSLLSTKDNHESVIHSTPSNPPPNTYQTQYIPRPGVVLDDPEFNPAQKVNHHHHNQRPRIPVPAALPPGYGEIFDVTLSAVQFGESNMGSHQTINIKPYNVYEGTDIILSPSGDQGFVSIDGKRTYINLFGESTDQPTTIESTKVVKENQIRPTNVYQPPSGVTGSGYVAVAETETITRKPQQHSYQQKQNRLVLKPKVPPQLPPVRIDTCIVGDDSTCDKAQNEKCMNDNGVSSCSCKQGYARRKHRDICRKIVSVVVSMRVDRYHDRKIVWDSSLNDSASEPFRSLKYESLRAVDSAMSMTPFSDEFMEATVNNIFQGDASKGLAGVFVNLTLMIEENAETIRPAIKNDIQRHLLGVIHRRNNNIGNSALFVDSAPGSVSAVVDLNECEFDDLNDCHMEASCTNTWGSYTCQCNSGLKDPYIDNPQRMGRECMSCDSSYCNNRGTCSFDSHGAQACTCTGFYYGSACEIDGEILFVSIGASVAAIFIIILTLICLVMWSRKWQREHKNAMIGSPLFGLGGYMGNAQVKAPIMGTVPYQMTLEDRMRWAQIADVMAQSNHYGAEPSRTLPTIYSGYPNLSGMMGGMTLPHNNHHNGTLPPPPVPLPRLGINRPSGLRNFENSSSSEEEDRTDLLGRSFQVPRPKSRAASVTSAIYYDVDYSPEQVYGGQNSSSNQIPLSTYSARPPSTTYYK